MPGTPTLVDAPVCSDHPPELAALSAALDALADADVATIRSGDALLAVQRELARFQAIVCRQAEAFDRSSEWTSDGAQNSAAWVTTRARIERSAARRHLRLGRALRAMDHVAAAFDAGVIGLDHVELLARARDRSTTTALAFARDELMLVGWASTEVFFRFRHRLDEWLLHADADAAEDHAERQRDGRRLHLSQSFENLWFLDGVLDPIDGQIVHDTLTAITDELFEADWRTATDALGRPPTGDEIARTPAQRRADALVEMARRAATAPADGRAPQPLFTVLVGEESFTRVCRLASGTIVTPGSVARWLDDAVIERIVFDGPDRVISVGHHRAFRGALRRAIQVLGDTCAHHYCDHPADECEIDHIQPHAAGGPTQLDNGRPLCGFHNRLRPGARKPPRFPE